MALWLVGWTPDRMVQVRALAGVIVLFPCNGLVSHPGRSRNTLSRFMLKKLVY